MTNQPLLLALALLFSFQIKAQFDVTSLDLDRDVTVWFDQSIGEQNLRIVSGDYYQVRNSSKVSHQFFLSDRWEIADIHYYNNAYMSLNVLYDVLDDILLIRHPTLHNYFSQPIRIHQENVSSFTFHGHTFRYYGSSENPPEGPGYYDELMVGDHLQLLAKRKKESSVDTGESYAGYKTVDEYFLRYQDMDYKIKGRRSIIRNLKPYKRPLRQYIRQFAIKVRGAEGLNDNQIIDLLKYCDGIIEGE